MNFKLQWMAGLTFTLGSFLFWSFLCLYSSPASFDASLSSSSSFVESPSVFCISQVCCVGNTPANTNDLEWPFVPSWVLCLSAPKRFTYVVLVHNLPWDWIQMLAETFSGLDALPWKQQATAGEFVALCVGLSMRLSVIFPGIAREETQRLTEDSTD